jgi:Leucine-rich repeat (LRR) protein
VICCLMCTQLYMSNLQTLKLSNNQIKNISNRFYNFLTSSTRFKFRLANLYLDKNQITDLGFLVNPFLEFLSTIDLSSNQIEAVSSDYFKNLKSLSHLYLSNNKIQTIGSNTFMNSKLELLDLSNQNSQFVFDMKDMNSNVNSIFLSGNNLNNLKFKKLPRLEKLVMSNVTTYSSLSMRFDFINTVIILDLSCNTIEFNANIIKFFSSLDRLISLNLSSVGLKSLDSLDLAKMSSIKTLDLSLNKIERLYKNQTSSMILVSSFYLNNNKISFIETDCFINMKNLVLIDLENNYLSYFSFYQFPVYNNIVTVKIQQLKYKKNLIKDLESLVNPKNILFDNIKLIDFSFNSISYFETYTFFSEENQVVEIYLNNNQILSISNTAFKIFSSLKRLSLEYNQISLIESYSFYLFNLENLNIAYNLLTQFNAHTFDGLFLLEHLNVSSNRLEFIQTSLFKDLFNLLVLDLSNNFLKRIEKMAFQSLSLMTDLYLQNGTIIEFQEEAFYGLQSIKNIFINLNYLDSSNVLMIQQSLKPMFYKNLLDIDYYKSINFVYFTEIINCSLTLNFIKHKLHLNLSTDADVQDFLDYCHEYRLNIEK